MKPFVEMKDKLDETAAKKMGIKDPEAYPSVLHFTVPVSVMII